jgi:dTMP kinase
MPESRGRFITLEGGEGAGKSTQLRTLASWLEARGIAVETTREPGGSPGAEVIRQLLVTGETGRWDGVSETLLHYAARHDHVVRRIEPALAGGVWVLCDRFLDSTLAYQGYGLGVDREVIEGIRRISLGDFAPDLTLILDIGAEASRARMAKRGEAADRYERMDAVFHARVRAGFQAIAAEAPERCVMIDAEAPADGVAEAIRQQIRARLGVS